MPLDDDASREHSQGDIKSKAFINKLVIISTYSDPIHVLVIMPCDYLKLCDNDDSAFGVYISSRFLVNRKSIELLSFSPPISAEEWQELIDFWADPKRMDIAKKNAQNRAKKKTTSHQGSKSFAQGRHEFMNRTGEYKDAISHWKRTHTNKDGMFKYENEDTTYSKTLAQDARNEAKEARNEYKDFITQFTAHFNQQAGSSSNFTPFNFRLNSYAPSSSTHPYDALAEFNFDPNLYQDIMIPGGCYKPRRDDEDEDDNGDE
nr:hypothetical protein [Tanacetum cinerariifolium]